MSYAQRRRLLWLLFLAGMLLIAMTARATTLVRLRFPDLVHYASAIARVRCVGADTRVENGEIFTDTRFHVLESEKGSFAGFDRGAPAGREIPAPGFARGRERRNSASERKSTSFSGDARAGSFMCWAGRKELSACTATPSPARKLSRRIPLKSPSSILKRMPSRRWVSKTFGSLCSRNVFAARFCARCPR